MYKGAFALPPHRAFDVNVRCGLKIIHKKEPQPCSAGLRFFRTGLGTACHHCPKKSRSSLNSVSAALTGRTAPTVSSQRSNIAAFCGASCPEILEDQISIAPTECRSADAALRLVIHLASDLNGHAIVHGPAFPTFHERMPVDLMELCQALSATSLFE